MINPEQTNFSEKQIEIIDKIHTSDLVKYLSHICDYPYINELFRYPNNVSFQIIKRYLKPYNKENIMKVLEEFYQDKGWQVEPAYFTLLFYFKSVQGMNKYHQPTPQECFDFLQTMKENRFIKIADL